MITSEMINAAFVNAMDKLGVAGSQGLRFSVYDSLDVQVRDLAAYTTDKIPRFQKAGHPATGTCFLVWEIGNS